MKCESIDDGMNTVDDLGKPDLRGHERNLYLEINVFYGKKDDMGNIAHRRCNRGEVSMNVMILVEFNDESYNVEVTT